MATDPRVHVTIVAKTGEEPWRELRAEAGQFIVVTLADGTTFETSVLRYRKVEAPDGP